MQADDLECAAMSVVEPFSDKYVVKVATNHTNIFATLYDEKNTVLSLQELVEMGKSLDFGNNEDHCDFVEELTSEQANIFHWFHYGTSNSFHLYGGCKNFSYETIQKPHTENLLPF